MASDKEDFVREQDLKHLGEWIKDRIVDRTLSGVDATGKAFLPKETGAKSTLNDTGRLMRSLKVRVTPNFEAAVENEVEYAPYVSVKRPFMGLTDKDIADFRSEVVKVFMEGAARVSTQRIYRGKR